MLWNPGVPCTLVLMVYVMLCRMVSSELYTSPLRMEALAHEESALLVTFAEYVDRQTERLAELKRRLDELTRARSSAILSAPEYVSDPVRAYTLVRRMAREWPIVVGLIEDTQCIEKNILQVLTEEDFQSAVRGMARIQEIYEIPPEELAPNNTTLSASDCMELGYHLYRRFRFEPALSWFRLAHRKVTEGDATSDTTAILTYIFLADTLAGCLQNEEPAQEKQSLYTLAARPDFLSDSRHNLDFRQALAGGCDWVREQLDLEQKKAIFHPDLIARASQLCRGSVDPPEEDFRCYYIRYNNPRLMLAPFKMEELHLDPPILKFHDVISDKEIEHLKTAFLYDVRDCANYNTTVDVQYRSCSMSWVTRTDSVEEQAVTRRVADMTNLSVGSSEPSQVARYGPAGEFRPHDDTLPRGVGSVLLGNRVATVMFYLSDGGGGAGGHTVFPLIGVSVEPQRGAALLWYNIDAHGRVLRQMLHAACPVRTGTKWVMNRWLHEQGQDPQFTCPVDGVFPKRYYYRKQ